MCDQNGCREVPMPAGNATRGTNTIARTPAVQDERRGRRRGRRYRNAGATEAEPLEATAAATPLEEAAASFAAAAKAAGGDR